MNPRARLELQLWRLYGFLYIRVPNCRSSSLHFTLPMVERIPSTTSLNDRSESQLLDQIPRLSPSTRQRGIIAERQEQLHREMLEINDTLTRGLRARTRIPAWDSSSVTSWTSSIGSAGRNRLRKNRTPVWDTMRGKNSYTYKS